FGTSVKFYGTEYINGDQDRDAGVADQFYFLSYRCSPGYNFRNQTLQLDGLYQIFWYYTGSSFVYLRRVSANYQLWRRCYSAQTNHSPWNIYRHIDHYYLISGR